VGARKRGNEERIVKPDAIAYIAKQFRAQVLFYDDNYILLTKYIPGTGWDNLRLPMWFAADLVEKLYGKEGKNE